MENKEYKVITCNTPMFLNSAKLKELLEAQAGWDLEELVDGTKIRVSRDKSHRSGDGNRTLDPYRISVGMNQLLYFGVAGVITILVIWAIIQAAALSVT